MVLLGRVVTGLALVVLSGLSKKANGASMPLSPKEALAVFCKAEFEGVAERYEIARLSEAYVAHRKSKGDILGGRVNLWGSDPHVLVRSFTIDHVDAEGEQGKATVTYERVGRSEGSDRFMIEEESAEVVEYTLCKGDDRWWVKDPPLPRVSVDAVLDFYDDVVQRLQRDVEPDPRSSPQQLESVRSKKVALEMLRTLKAAMASPRTQ